LRSSQPGVLPGLYWRSGSSRGSRAAKGNSANRPRSTALQRGQFSRP
jgi:hypothetical protein